MGVKKKPPAKEPYEPVVVRQGQSEPPHPIFGQMKREKPGANTHANPVPQRRKN